jgi:hypothetical protein
MKARRAPAASAAWREQTVALDRLAAGAAMLRRISSAALSGVLRRSPRTATRRPRHPRQTSGRPARLRAVGGQSTWIRATPTSSRASATCRTSSKPVVGWRPRPGAAAGERLEPAGMAKVEARSSCSNRVSAGDRSTVNRSTRTPAAAAASSIRERRFVERGGGNRRQAGLAKRATAAPRAGVGSGDPLDVGEQNRVTGTRPRRAPTDSTADTAASTSTRHPRSTRRRQRPLGVGGISHGDRRDAHEVTLRHDGDASTSRPCRREDVGATRRSRRDPRAPAACRGGRSSNASSGLAIRSSPLSTVVMRSVICSAAPAPAVHPRP